MILYELYRVGNGRMWHIQSTWNRTQSMCSRPIDPDAAVYVGQAEGPVCGGCRKGASRHINHLGSLLFDLYLMHDLAYRAEMYGVTVAEMREQDARNAAERARLHAVTVAELTRD